MFPVFHVQRALGETSNAIVGTVTSTTNKQQNWVGDGRIGFLKNRAQVIIGQWRSNDELWAFTPENAANVPVILAVSVWEVLDGHWGERVAIVLDETRQWHKTYFKVTDAIQWRRNTDGELTSETIKDGWDHEHCAICWEKIGAFGQEEGYVSNRTWVCEQCYTHYVTQRSWEFITTA